ncbi:uncharacterized protein DEA37_0010682 [Paragonimus westermani]|uniref:G-protein coupled receptors family 1 profile domain-containing protein n=1 Tax=Paragonimus westermani TaxID=34504 RepID=A0A5J4P4W4_9TREM|nr:uncharacterized protein DEA37_0010682 [Paragonimus westermani]
MFDEHLLESDFNDSFTENLWVANITFALNLLGSYGDLVKPYLLFKHFVTVPVTLISIVCIIITIVVLTRRGIWRPAITYLVVLATVDLLIMILLCVLSLDYFLLPLFNTKMYVAAENVLSEIVDTLLFISNWLTVILATERYIVIGYPTHSRRITQRHRRLVVLITVLLSTLIKIPGFLFLASSEPLETQVVLPFTRKFYVWFVQTVLFLIVPFVLLTFVNIRLIQAVRHSWKPLKLASEYGTSHTPKDSQVSPDVFDKNSGVKDRHNYMQVSSLIRVAQQSYFVPTNKNSRALTVVPCAEKRTREIPVKTRERESMVVHPQMTRSCREERKITVTLVCLFVTFFIFQGPFILTSVITRFTLLHRWEPTSISSANPKHPMVDSACNGSNFTPCLLKSVNFEVYLTPLSILALALKSDLYFLFYCWFCARFLNSLRRLLCSKKLRRFVNQLRHRCFSLSAKIGSTNSKSNRKLVLERGNLPYHCYDRCVRLQTNCKHICSNQALKNNKGFRNVMEDRKITLTMPFVLSPEKRFTKNYWHRNCSSVFGSFDAKAIKFCSAKNSAVDTNLIYFTLPPSCYCSQRRIVVTSHRFPFDSPIRDLRLGVIRRQQKDHLKSNLQIKFKQFLSQNTPRTNNNTRLQPQSTIRGKKATAFLKSTSSSSVTISSKHRYGMNKINSLSAIFAKSHLTESQCLSPPLEQALAVDCLKCATLTASTDVLSRMAISLAEESQSPNDCDRELELKPVKNTWSI